MNVLREGFQVVFCPVDKLAHVGNGFEMVVQLGEIIAVDNPRATFGKRGVMLQMQVAEDSLGSDADISSG